jgi:Putative Ig domain
MLQTRAESKKWDAFLSWGEAEAGVRAISESIGTRPMLPELTLAGEAQSAFTQDITAIGGDGTVKLELIGGELPPGLSFTQTGSGTARISGTPTVDGLFRFVVRALDGDKDPDYRAYSLSIDPMGVMSNALVVFRGQDIPGTVPNNGWIARFDASRPTVDVQTSSVLTRTYVPFSMSSALFNKESLEVPGTPKVLASTSPENMYGGWSLTSLATSGTPTISAFVGLRDHQWSAWTGDSSGGPTVLDGVLLWKAEQFSALGGSGLYSFGSDAAHAMLRLDMSALSLDQNEIHFVVVNHDAGGDTFYLSEAAYTSNYLGDGYFQLGAFSGSSEVGKRWAVFAPTADAFALPASPSFTAKAFNDVRAVGIAFRIARGGWHYSFGFPRFLALGQRN